MDNQQRGEVTWAKVEKIVRSLEALRLDNQLTLADAILACHVNRSCV